MWKNIYFSLNVLTLETILELEYLLIRPDCIFSLESIFFFFK